MNIPTFDFRGNKFVNEDGKLTDVAQGFMDELINALIAAIGQEGSQVAQQSADNITTIQNNQIISATGIITNTAQYGTIMYDSTNNTGRFSINNGSNLPIFKTITLT
jgi:hypothetical protein